MDRSDMKQMSFFRQKTHKSLVQFVSDLESSAESVGFKVVHKGKSNIADFYASNGVMLPKDFDLEMIQICRPEVSGPILYQNPARAVFIQKYIFVFTKNGLTEICALRYSAGVVAELLEETVDDGFSKRQEESFEKTKDIIMAAL